MERCSNLQTSISERVRQLSDVGGRNGCAFLHTPMITYYIQVRGMYFQTHALHFPRCDIFGQKIVTATYRVTHVHVLYIHNADSLHSWQD